MLPVGDIGQRPPDDVAQGAMAFFVEPVGEPVDQVVDDLEAVVHRRGADLHRAGAQRMELRGIAPGGDAADAGDGDTGALGVARDLGHHVERDRLDRRPAIAAVRALAVDHGLRRHAVEIDADDRVHGVDQ